MADLIEVLPKFDLVPWRHLTYSLEKKNVLTAELISLDPIEIARRCPLPLREVRRMVAAVLEALKTDLGYRSTPPLPPSLKEHGEPVRKKPRLESKELQPEDVRPQPQVLRSEELRYVKTLDPLIDECLGGGFPAGSICEIVGESAVGKTQFVMSLLLTAQLPPPLGLGKSTLYLSTESALTTTRLVQMLHSQPQYNDLPPERRPTTDKVYYIDAHTVEDQDHTITFKLPEAVRRYNLGLVVIDSIAANYRVEFQGASRKVLGERAVALVKLGRTLRKIAHDNGVTIICTNQVADRFDDDRTRADKLRLISSQSQGLSQTVPKPASGRATPIQPPIVRLQNQPPATTQALGGCHHPSFPSHQAHKDEIISLDFQQRFFTGWGDNGHNSPFEHLKTPALGLTWANQIDARIALKISDTLDRDAPKKSQVESESYLRSLEKRRRHLKVVFAPWVAPTMDSGVEYDLEMQGPVSVEAVGKGKSNANENFDFDDDDDDDDVVVEHEDLEISEYAELLDPKYWEDEEFP